MVCGPVTDPIQALREMKKTVPCPRKCDRDCEYNGWETCPRSEYEERIASLAALVLEQKARAEKWEWVAGHDLDWNGSEHYIERMVKPRATATVKHLETAYAAAHSTEDKP